jgi:hypothetical protein
LFIFLRGINDPQCGFVWKWYAPIPIRIAIWMGPHFHTHRHYPIISFVHNKRGMRVIPFGLLNHGYLCCGDHYLHIQYIYIYQFFLDMINFFFPFSVNCWSPNWDQDLKDPVLDSFCRKPRP